MAGDGSRFAVYAAPVEDAALWRFGAAILGYDPATGAETEPDRPPLDGFDWVAATEEPRRYGFHGTLKAPFRLAPGCGEAELAAALSAFTAAPRAPIVFAPAVRVLAGFVAIVPAAPCPPLHALADDCVRAFDGLRAPLGEAERARRRPERLTARQRALLDAFGYPYVFEEFRFHMTLTGRLDPADAERARAALEAALHARRGTGAVAIASLALFRQDGPDARFRIIGRWPLAVA